MANNYKNKSKKRPPKSSNQRVDDRNFKHEQKSCDYVGKENDPSWYNKLNTLITDVTKIPFTNQIGRVYDYQNPDIVNLVTPGIFTLDYVLCPGVAKTASDGVNIAATALFQTIRKDLSTYASYAPADVMMYVLAHDSLIAAYNYIKRMFGIANLYSSINLNYGNTLLRAAGLSSIGVMDFRANMGTYIARFNNLVYKASTLYLPNRFSIIERHAWLFSNVFIDGKDAKSQIYMHKPAGFYLLDEITSEEGTSLRYMSFGYGRMDDMLALFDEAIELLRNSDSMNKIAADMKRAIPGATWTFEYINNDYVVVPTYSQEVLSQIENTSILFYPTPDSLRITQSVDNNIILYDPDFVVNSSEYATDQTTPLGDVEPELHVPNSVWQSAQILNMHWANPSSDDVAVATRNMITLKHKTGRDDDIFGLSSCGSDYCVNASIWTYSTEYGEATRFDVTKYMALGTPLIDDLTLLSYQLKDWMSFDWAPTQYVGQLDENGMLIGISPLVEFANYTLIEPQVLDNMHNNIIASMWAVPQFGTITK